MNNMSNSLFLVWRNPISNKKHVIGELKKTSHYTFHYINLSDAKKDGWRYLVEFPEEKEYKSSRLFATFATRLPDRKRPDIQRILTKYGLTQYDEFDLLRKSGSKLPIDTYELVEPSKVVSMAVH